MTITPEMTPDSGACPTCTGALVNQAPTGLGPDGLRSPSVDDVWHYCGSDRGGCSCMMVWSTQGDAPVCTVKKGEWGDEWPSLRFVEGDGMAPRAEAFMERMIYGEIPEDHAKANAFLISAAPELLRAARKALNYIANTEGEFGITLDSGDTLRAAIAKAEGRTLARIEARSGETREAGLDHEVTKAGIAPNPLGEQGAS